MAMPVERIGDSNAPFSLGRTISLRRLEVNRPKCTNPNFLTSNRSALKRVCDEVTDRPESRSGIASQAGILKLFLRIAQAS